MRHEIHLAAFLAGIALSGTAFAGAKVIDLTTKGNAEVATLTCLPQEKGFPKQKLYIETVDGRKAGTWSRGISKAVKIDAGKHKVAIRYVNVLVVQNVYFEFEALAGHDYSCIGETEGPNLNFSLIKDNATQAVVGEPISASCYFVNGKCV